MGAQQGEPEDLRWKGKYSELLREQLECEQTQKKQQDMLKKGLTRLCDLAMGADSALDTLLERLRKEIRAVDVDDSVTELIHDIDRIASELTGEERRMLEDWRRALGELLNQFKRVLPESLDHGLVELREQLSDTKNSPEQLQCVESLARLLETQAQHLGEAPIAVDDISGEERQATESEPAFIKISARIEAVLKDMVGGLNVPDSVRDSKKSIESAINRGLNWYELIVALEDLSLVVSGTLYESEKDYEAFLQQTLRSLTEVHLIANTCETLEHDSVAKSANLQTQVSLQLQVLNEALESESDIDRMKAAVQQGLDSIATDVTSYGSAREAGAEELQKHVRALAAQVVELQGEANVAKNLLEEQREKANTDPLTCLPNRTAYDERIQLEYKRWARYQRPLTIAVGDIDFFKKLNDSFGHLAGDAVLSGVAGKIKDCLRQTDFVARYGGEEFVFLMPETDEVNAQAALNKLREIIEQQVFEFDDQVVRVSMSFGLTGFVEHDNPISAFARADKAVYMAKSQGRNCCVLAPRELGQSDSAI